MRVMLGSDRGTQPVLLPTDVRDLLPPDHDAWTYLAIVNDEMDMSGLRAYYRADGRGRPPYDPAMMVALLLYCGRKKIRSTRDIEQSCKDDLGCRLITGNRVIDHCTINAFVRTHGTGLRALLGRSVRLCAEAGLVDLDLLAADGSKWTANAAMTATLDEATLRERINELTAQVAEREARWAEAVAGEHGTQPGLFDLDLDLDLGAGAAAGDAVPAGPIRGRTDKAWRQLRQAQHALHTHQRALQHLLARPTNSAHRAWQAKLARAEAAVEQARQRLEQVHTELAAAYQQRAERETAGQRVPGTRPVPITEHTRTRKAQTRLDNAIARAQRITANPPPVGTVNITDPTSRIMPNKHGGHDQNHNVQIAAVRSQVILGICRHDNPNDKQALKGLLKTARGTLDAAAITDPIGTAVADNGYASEENFTTDHPVTRLLIATGRDPGHNDHTDHPAWQNMAEQLAQPENRKLYNERAGIIEPVFAQLFTQFGRRLDRHGEHVDTELHLWATGHNLAKLIRHRRRELTRRARPPN